MVYFFSFYCGKDAESNCIWVGDVKHEGRDESKELVLNAGGRAFIRGLFPNKQDVFRIFFCLETAGIALPYSGMECMGAKADMEVSFYKAHCLPKETCFAASWRTSSAGRPAFWR